MQQLPDPVFKMFELQVPGQLATQLPGWQTPPFAAQKPLQVDSPVQHPGSAAVSLESAAKATPTNTTPSTNSAATVIISTFNPFLTLSPSSSI